ncbi:hypothetical protein HZC31_05590 [Candidatus Woesearchaeota archaeon]|nr:hypothetical protein [Candidatus Woesearchaeota archaeon]
MGRKTIALSVDEDIYDKYKEYCKKNFVVLSRKIEDFMKKDLENGDKEND